MRKSLILLFLTCLFLRADATTATARAAFENGALAAIPSSVYMRHYTHAPDSARYDKETGTAKYLFVLSYKKSTRARFLEGIVSRGKFVIGRMLEFGQPERKVLAEEFEQLRTDDAMFAIRLDGTERPYVCLYPKRSFENVVRYADVHSLAAESPASTMVGNLKTSSASVKRGGKLRWGVFGCRATYTGADGLVVDLGTVDADSSIAAGTILAKCRAALEAAHPDRVGTVSDRDVMDWCRGCTKTYEPCADYYGKY